MGIFVEKILSSSSCRCCSAHRLRAVFIGHKAKLTANKSTKYQASVHKIRKPIIFMNTFVWMKYEPLFQIISQINMRHKIFWEILVWCRY